MLSKFNNKKHRRLTALLLCAALMLGSVTSVSADISAADSETEVQNYAEESSTEAVSYEAPETQAEVQEGTPVAEETEAPAADTQQTEAHTEASTEAHTETASETQAEPETETPVSEATELRQDFTDGISVIANLPDGAFEAATSDITMQVNRLTSAQLTYITSLMDKEIDKDTYEVGDYVIFDIKFIVNGVETEPLKEITVNIKNSKINVGDVESAKVFYFDPHDTNTSSDDELAEISQRSLLIKEFQKAGKSTANIDDYDLSNIILNDKGKATEINFEARKNTIYGCYVVNEMEKESETEDINKEETESETELESESESESETENELYTTDFTNQTLDYEDAQVKISVEAVEENAIPEEASLSVTPIVKDNSDTSAQYEAVEKLLQEKVENEDYDIAGFLAYDITLVDADGNKVEPNGEVKVTMNYKQAVIADEAVQTVENTDGLESTADLGIAVMHLEEDEQGNVQNVVNMTEENKADIAATQDSKVEKTEITTNSFSTYALAWTAETVAQSADGSVTLTETYGKMTATYTGSATDYKYVWYRSINGGYFELQTPVQYTGTDGTALGSDIKDDGTELYISLNGGALTSANTNVQYKVAVYAADAFDKDGDLKEDATPLAESIAKSVTGYDEIRNGSFENPVVTDNHLNTNNWQYSNENYQAQGGVWQTTGTHNSSQWSDADGADIEIVTTKTKNQNGTLSQSNLVGYSWYGTVAAADGIQFAELNCEAAGALYQDILTTPGETLNYQLAHRARGNKKDATEENDTMYVVIMSTQMAVDNNVTTQARVQDIINNQSNYPGATVVSYTDNDQMWTYHQGAYKVNSDGQYSTRFFFVAGNTASGNNTVGNFLDDIKFTRDKLTPVEGTASVTVEKTIVGLEYEAAKTLAEGLEFNVGTHKLTYNELTWSWADGIYTGTSVISIPEHECGTLDVNEAATTGKSLDVTGYDRNSSLYVDGTVILDATTSGQMKIKTGQSKTVSFSNVYTVQNGGGFGEDVENKMSHEKYIKKNADGTYDITLNASGSVGTQVNKAKVDIVLVMDISGSMDKSDGSSRKSKLANAKDAVNALVAAFSAKNDTVDARYKLVTFAKGSSIATDSWVDGSTLKTKVSKLNADGGTNYDKGLSNAATAVSAGARTDAKKIVIFLTDGQPTYYGSTSNCGVHTSYNTLSKALTSAALIKCSDFYAVGIGLPGSIPIYKNDSGNCQYGTNHGGDWWNQNPTTETISGKELLERVSAKVTATTKDTWNLTDSSQLTDKFKQIAGETLTFACSNVKITDQLSDYVKVTDDSKIHVKVAQRGDNNTYTDKFDATFNLNQSGAVTLNNKTIATASYDATTKTAVLDFADDYQLEENYYYYITITNLKATDKAYEDYIKYGGYKTDQGAPIVGSTPTDTSATKDNEFGYYATNGSNLTGGAISSGKFGFKSNADAKVEYTWKGTAKTEDYLDPVIQVSVDQIKVEKDWAELGDTTVSKNVVLAQLVKLSTEKDVEDNDVITVTPVAGKIIKLADSNNFSGAFIVRNASDYAIRELKLDANGSITYEGKKYSIANEGDVTTFDNISYKVSYATDDSGKSVTITNTKSSETIRIIKAGTDTNLLLEGAEFTLVDSNGKTVTVGTTATKGGSYISDANGLVLEGIINAGTYTLTEIKAPSGYIKLADSITITVGSNGDNKVTVSGPEGKVTCAKDDHNVYVITVQNEVIYELPSTGGSGIYWFSICGMLLMMAAAWIIYKNKCREVLVK